MRSLKALWLRFRGVFVRRKAMEFDAELESHIAMDADDAMRAGLSSEEAHRQALLRLGGVEQTRQAFRDRATLPPVESVLQDLSFAVRQMRRAPGFTITAVLTLALGIGANAIIYTLVDCILLRPLPYARQDRLVRISGENSPTFPKGWIRELGAHATALKAVAGYGPDAESNISESDIPDRVFGAMVTVNSFDTLGIHPELGSFFSAADANAGEDHDVVLSYGYWRQHFDADPSAIGRQIRIDGVSRRIIGVMPIGVHFPYADTQFVIPVSYRGGDVFDPWSDFNLRAFGRLADGATPAQAQAELRRLHAVLLPIFPFRMPDIWASDMTAVPLLESQTGSMRPRLLLLFGAVGLILLIACANVANLMLARATAREREIAVRSALGASGRRLVQQLLSESVVMGLTAGAVGLGAALASLRLFVHLLPADTPRIQDVSLHFGDITFTLCASVLAGLMFGLIPSIKMASMNLLSTLRIGGRTLLGTGSRFGLSMFLVVAQIGLTVVVITAAGLVLHSLYRLTRVDPGFRADHTVTAEVSLDAAACKQKGRCQSFFTSLLDRAQGIAGVESAALVDSLPLSGRENNYIYDAEDHPRDARQGARLATSRIVSTGYFNVLNLHLLRGRLLDAQDASGTTQAVVVNESIAQRLWPNQDPLGKHLLSVEDESAPAVWNAEKASIVVGVVRNAREGGLEEGFKDEVFLPMTPSREQPVMYAMLRTHTTASEAAAGLRSAVAGIDSLVPITRVRSLDEVVATSVAAPRALAMLLVGFGGLAVIIGAVGVYSLISYMVSWRTREIGLRLALGAQRWQIVLSVVRQSLILAGAGCVIGLAGSVALSRLLHSFLFEVSTLDPVTFCLIPLLMALVALVAAWIPARRAAAVDPMEALRAD
ncbi:ABC transporter permease [Telmatobacter sp. DSM 110680]|uniref:ABC transporter permease n=1 Tax=Telmatobacter sp. DSM 110680 TaxID=3036704 RepID=A0AAU7DMZ0_9BACT